MTSRKRAAGVVAVCVFLALGAISGASFVAWKHDRDDRNRLNPLVLAMNDFIVPASAKQAIPEGRTTKPLRVIRGWTDSDELDVVCNRWSDAFRTWLGAEQSLGSVTGEFTPGQSCSLSGKKGEYDATLVIGAYGTEPPQALLTLTDE